MQSNHCHRVPAAGLGLVKFSSFPRQLEPSAMEDLTRKAVHVTRGQGWTAPSKDATGRGQGVQSPWPHLAAGPWTDSPRLLSSQDGPPRVLVGSGAPQRPRGREVVLVPQVSLLFPHPYRWSRSLCLPDLPRKLLIHLTVFTGPLLHTDTVPGTRAAVSVKNNKSSEFPSWRSG